jgi:opacity protein-like surface antigen
MRTLIAVALSTTLLASAAFAADNVGPLPAGKPAGVKEAQIGQTGWILLGVGAVAAIAIGAASSSNGSPVGQQNNIAVTATTI